MVEHPLPFDNPNLVSLINLDLTKCGDSYVFDSGWIKKIKKTKKIGKGIIEIRQDQTGFDAPTPTQGEIG
jgi:hypothetical protein